MKRNIKLSTRLALGFGVLLALMIIMVLLAFFSIDQVLRSMSNIIELNTTKIIGYTDLKATDLIIIITRNIRTMILLSDQARELQLNETIKKNRKKYNQLHDEVRKDKFDAGAQEIK